MGISGHKDSLKELLDNILPKILPEGVSFKTIPHSGKSDLQKSIPRKLKGWGTNNTSFVILHDKDSNDCIKLKRALQALCDKADRPDTLVRIVCTELESWYLGDLAAVEEAYNIKNLSKQQTKSKFRDPDSIENAAEEIKKIVKSYQKISGARLISKNMNISNNLSKSFNIFVEGIKRICG